jgi:hypothetical protein
MMPIGKMLTKPQQASACANQFLLHCSTAGLHCCSFDAASADIAAANIKPHACEKTTMNRVQWELPTTATELVA